MSLNKAAVELMKARGYVPSAEVARVTTYSGSSIRNWANDGKVKGLRLGGQLFVCYEDLIKHLTPEVAEALGLEKIKPT